MRLFSIQLVMLFCWMMSSVNAKAEEPFKLNVAGSIMGIREANQQDVIVGVKTAFNETLSKVNISSDFKIYNNSDELITALKNDEVNAFFGSPIEYFKMSDLLWKAPVLCANIAGTIQSRLVVLVRKNSGINNLAQLKSKSINIPSWLKGDVGLLYLDTLLLEKKLPQSKEFFADMPKNDNSNMAIIGLFYGKADAALVREAEWNIANMLNPQLKQSLIAIEISDPYINFLTAGTNNIPQRYINPIISSLIDLKNSSKGRNILKQVKVDGFEECTPDALNNVQTLLSKYQKLSDNNNKRKHAK